MRRLTLTASLLLLVAALASCKKKDDTPQYKLLGPSALLPAPSPAVAPDLRHPAALRSPLAG